MIDEEYVCVKSKYFRLIHCILQPSIKMLKVICTFMTLLVILAILCSNNVDCRAVRRVSLLTKLRYVILSFLLISRVLKEDQQLHFIFFALVKINSIMTIAMKMIVVNIFMLNEKVNFYHHYMVYHMLLSIHKMRTKYENENVLHLLFLFRFLI
jgi:hypothetical protein